VASSDDPRHDERGGGGEVKRQDGEGGCFRHFVSPVERAKTALDPTDIGQSVLSFNGYFYEMLVPFLAEYRLFLALE
jgi:hypothetical protein